MPGKRFERSPDTAERDASAARLRAEGKTFQQIATALSYTDRSGARKAVQRALVATVQEAGDDLRVLELERLDRLLDVAWQVMERVHYAHSAGRLIRGDGDAPVVDDEPTLKAIDRILRISERRAKLLGLDAPVRHDVLTLDAIDAEIARLEAVHAEFPSGGGSGRGARGPDRAQPGRSGTGRSSDPVDANR